MEQNKKTGMLLVVAVYLLDRFLSLPGVPLLGISVWGRYPETFENLGNTTYLQFFMKAVLLLFLIMLILKRREEKFSDIYLSRPGRIYLEIAAGFMFFIFLFYVDDFISYAGSFSVLGKFLETREAIGSFGAWLYANPAKSIVFLILAAGVYEETLASFLFVSMVKVFGDGKSGATASMVAVSLMFGLSHLYQGSYGFYKVFAQRILYLVLLIWRKNLAAPMAAHILYDSEILLGNPLKSLLPFI